jgi:molecular chaperone IbpA
MSHRQNPFANHFLAQVIGIDRFLNVAESALSRATESTFPPYNIVKVGENDYLIELAVAGFALEDLNVDTKERVLVITGERKNSDIDPSDFLVRGIANRGFKRELQLAEFVEVKGAALKDGILSIKLSREVPDSQRHRKIDIVTVPSKADHEVASVG